MKNKLIEVGIIIGLLLIPDSGMVQNLSLRHEKSQTFAVFDIWTNGSNCESSYRREPVDYRDPGFSPPVAAAVNVIVKGMFVLYYQVKTFQKIRAVGPLVLEHIYQSAMDFGSLFVE